MIDGRLKVQSLQSFSFCRGAAEAAGAGGGAGDVGPAAAAAVLFHFAEDLVLVGADLR